MHRNDLKKDKMYANYAYVTISDLEVLSKYKGEQSDVDEDSYDDG